MSKRVCFVLMLTLLTLLIYLVFKIKFMSYTSIVILIVSTLLLDIVYTYKNPKYSKVLVISDLLSTVIFSVYIVVAINENPPVNAGDFSLLPILLFVVSLPLIITTHLAMIIKVILDSQNKVSS